MNKDIIDIWLESKESVKSILPDEITKSRIETTELKIWLPGENKKNISNQYSYHPEYRIPAFYEPNENNIYVNEPLIERVADDLVADILHHELIHAAGDHSIIEDESTMIYKSGLKMQCFNKDNERCYWRGLNEGFVQYKSNGLCGKITNSRAYQGEVKIVKKLVEIIGEEHLNYNFFHNRVRAFYQRIDEAIGLSKMRDVSRRVDQGEYKWALRLLEQ